MFGFKSLGSLFSLTPKAAVPMAAPTTPVLSLADRVGQSAIVMRAAAVGTITRLRIQDLMRNGRLKHQALFRFNQVTIRNMQNRKAVLRAIGTAPRADFMALPFEQRKLLFAFVKQETARYNGTAIRQKDTPGGKRGEPLPKLQFPTPVDAAAYRQLLQNAMSTMRRHISN